MRKILITGGAGYIGSVLTRLLLREGFIVRVVDSLRYGGESLVELLNFPNFEFQNGDIRDRSDMKKAMDKIDVVVHLAAIVGDPACAKKPEIAREVNLDATKEIYLLSNRFGVQRFIMASTCSNYGRMSNPDTLVDESSELAPVSLYAETKVEAEKFLLNQDKRNNTKPTCLRFSTVYGLSPRMRFDLTVNEFTKELALKRELVVFGEQFWRPYCHVEDLARSVVCVIGTSLDKVAFNVFNVGDTKENYQKRTIVEEILKKLPDSKIRYVNKKEDPRDYRVSFDKIYRELKYMITKTVPIGIFQIIQVVKNKLIKNPDDQKYVNY